jgi:hypothetical protein
MPAINLQQNIPQMQKSPIPIILRRNIFILLDPPVSWEVFEPQLLSLEDKLRSALGNLQDRKQLGRFVAPFVRVIPESGDHTRVVMIFQEDSIIERDQ